MKHPSSIRYAGRAFHLQSTGRYYSGRAWRGERLLHRQIWVEHHGAIPEGMHVHHIDGDWTNNAVENLELVEQSHHQREHMAKRWSAGRSAMLEHLDAAREKASAWHGSEEGRAWHREHGAQTWLDREKESLTCAHCGKLAERFFTARANVRFCSRNCEQASRYKRKRVERTCFMCGTKYMAPVNRGVRTCSRSCGAKMRWSK